ncbi:hypothetical protein BGX34_001274 [Mortierella sp. NVP85]|nr:hypothetical protein BGX34_001274 [Mortierella sp. NVP85]
MASLRPVFCNKSRIRPSGIHTVASESNEGIEAVQSLRSGLISHTGNTHTAHQTVLQEHCDFFDSDHGIIWPIDTYLGFHALGLNFLLCLLAVFLIHANISYPTSLSWIPDPFFRIWVARIHKDKYGSSSGTYDTDGRFVPQHFEDLFAKYAPEGQNGLSLDDVWKVLNDHLMNIACSIALNMESGEKIVVFGS